MLCMLLNYAIVNICSKLKYCGIILAFFDFQKHIQRATPHNTFSITGIHERKCNRPNITNKFNRITAPIWELSRCWETRGKATVLCPMWCYSHYVCGYNMFQYSMNLQYATTFFWFGPIVSWLIIMTCCIWKPHLGPCTWSMYNNKKSISLAYFYIRWHENNRLTYLALFDEKVPTQHPKLDCKYFFNYVKNTTLRNLQNIKIYLLLQTWICFCCTKYTL